MARASLSWHRRLRRARRPGYCSFPFPLTRPGPSEGVEAWSARSGARPSCIAVPPIAAHAARSYFKFRPVHRPHMRMPHRTINDINFRVYYRAIGTADAGRARRRGRVALAPVVRTRHDRHSSFDYPLPPVACCLYPVTSEIRGGRRSHARPLQYTRDHGRVGSRHGCRTNRDSLPRSDVGLTGQTSRANLTAWRADTRLLCRGDDQ